MKNIVTMKLKLGSSSDLALIIMSFFTICYAIRFKTSGKDPFYVFNMEYVNYFFVIALLMFVSFIILNLRRGHTKVELVKMKDNLIIIQSLGKIPFSGYVIKNIVEVKKELLKEVRIHYKSHTFYSANIIFLIKGARPLSINVNNSDVVNGIKELISSNSNIQIKEVMLTNSLH